MKRSIYIILFCLTFGHSFAQIIELGGEIGYGSTYLHENIVFKEFFGPNAITDLGSGFHIAFNPKKTIIFINSGIIYILKGDNNYSFNNIRVPLGIKIEPGRKAKFIVGGGIYLNYLFLPEGDVNIEFKKTKRDFQIGGYFDSGFKYQLLENWNLFFLVQVNYDLSTLYMEENPHHDGSRSNSAIRSYDLSLRLGFSYLIPIKNESK